MNIQTAKKLLLKDINYLPLEQLQEHKVKLLDAWRHSKADYGFKQAAEEGFYCSLESESASGYVPKDIWLTYNLSCRIDEVLLKEQQLLNKGLSTLNNS